MNVLALNPGEQITAAVSIPNFEDAKFCTMATEQGYIKRVELSEFSSVRPSGLIAMSLKDEDKLGWVQVTSGEDEVMMMSAYGRALRMDEKEIRCMGRPAGGVTGIRMDKGDRVIGMDVLIEDADLLVITDKGYGKRTPLDQFMAKSRGSKGVSSIDKHSRSKIGYLAAARIVEEEDEVTLISTNGVIIRLNVEDISSMGRTTRGVRVMDINDGDSVATMARINASILKDKDETPAAAPEAAAPQMPEAAVPDVVEEETTQEIIQENEAEENEE